MRRCSIQRMTFSPGLSPSKRPGSWMPAAAVVSEVQGAVNVPPPWVQRASASSVVFRKSLP